MSGSGYAKLLNQLQKWGVRTTAVLFYVDIRRLRSVNRLASPAIGDALVSEVARVLREWAGDDGIALRLWSDEFVAARAIDHAQQAAEHGMELRRQLTQLRYTSDYGESALSISLGAICARPPFDWPSLIDHAADACETAKDRGLNQICFHHNAAAARRSPLRMADRVAEFRRLLDEDRLGLHAQPIMAIATETPRVAKAEFLLRIERDGVWVPPPAGMIEALENNGLSAELDRFSANTLLAWLADNEDALERLSGVSMNLSARSFVDGMFMSHLFDDIKHARLPPGKLSFEITETAAIQNLHVAADVIGDFQSLGCRFSLDDFGSGLCSFGYLQSLPVDEVKIDGRFVREIADNLVTQEIVRAIHQIARATGKTTVAEFVDDARKLVVLRDIGFDYAQGWLFYPALAPERFLELLQAPSVAPAAATALAR